MATGGQEGSTNRDTDYWRLPTRQNENLSLQYCYYYEITVPGVLPRLSFSTTMAYVSVEADDVRISVFECWLSMITILTATATRRGSRGPPISMCALGSLVSNDIIAHSCGKAFLGADPGADAVPRNPGRSPGVGNADRGR